MSKAVEVTAQEVVRQFGRYSDLALQSPVVVTRHGRARTVMISADEYARLKRRDREVLDFARLEGDQRDALVAALEQPLPARRPDLDAELDGWEP